MSPRPQPPGQRANATVLRNLMANLLGRGWAGFVGLVFIPVYVRILGVDAYGLVGVYASLTALLRVLDLGLSATLSRQLARLSAQPGSEQEARDLVRTMEWIYWGIGTAIGLAVVVAAHPIATYWIHSERIPPETVQQSIIMMGAVAALEWPAALYSGGLTGLQRQVLLNGARGGLGTLQAVGSVGMLWLVSPTIIAYFAWQATVMLIQAVVLARCLWGTLAQAEKPASFNRALLKQNSGFAAGMTGIALLSTLLTHLDKVVLSKYLSLDAFGCYSLAFSLAGATGLLVQPVFAAVLPRLSQVVLTGDERAVAALYHQSSRVLSVLVLPVATIAAFFSSEALLVWTGDATITEHTSLLLSILTVGSLFNGLAAMPFMLQLAYGWTRLSVVKNVIAVSLSVPLLLWLVQHHGAVGAAYVWVAVNAGYLVFEAPYMHQRLLRGELGGWYLFDNGVPLLLTVATCFASRVIMPETTSTFLVVTWVVVTWVLAVAATAVFQLARSGTNLRDTLWALVGAARSISSR
jgi:O-antigen/teichoic acid export membrane protein